MIALYPLIFILVPKISTVQGDFTMKHILLFAGTTEGRLLTEYLIHQPVRLHVCVATEYGEKLLPSAPSMTVSSHRMDKSQIIDFIHHHHFDLVLDATHPYAIEASANISGACEETHIPCLRILRDCRAAADIPSDAGSTSEVFVDTTEQAVDFLNHQEGPVFLTTGSKTLPDFMQIANAPDRIYVRILPNAEMLAACASLGLPASHIFCMQGPFDISMNTAAIRHICKRWEKDHPDSNLTETPLYMVTKQSGRTGGFDEKLEAAAQAQIPLLVIGRPKETSGLSLSESYHWLAEWIGKVSSQTPESTSRQTVSLIGTGMSASQLTLEADLALKNCDVIIGARRMLEMAEHYHKPTFCSYDYPAITDYMLSHPEYRHFAVLFSGDIGFYSGAAGLRRCLKGKPFKIEAFSGISSPIHFLNTIGKTWSDVHLISCHGQSASIISHVRRHAKTLALLGKPDDVSNISRKLIDYGLSSVRLYIGADLKQPEEQIVTGSPADFLDRIFSALSLIYIENPDAEQAPVTYGLPDDAFIRGKVPMTKSEIRSVALSKLNLTEDAILFDIGAGTGSIAIDAARQIPNGRVYAIERNPDGLALIKENSIHLQADNLTIVSGTAPESLDTLPAATHAFIGGSAGHLKEILQLLYSRNPEIRIVITAITLETIGQIITLQKEMALPDPEIVQIQVSSARKAGPYHLMQGQNPVYIVSF